MAEIRADRVLETSTTTGTGTYTLAGAVTGFRAFSAVCANNDTCEVYVEEVDGNGNPSGGWECGIYTWGTGGTLARTTIYGSSNAGAAVNWAAGTRRLAIGMTAYSAQKYWHALKSSDQTAIGTSYADVTGTGLPVAASTSYAFRFGLRCDADATTTGIDVACNGPASPTSISYTQTYWTSATALAARGATAYDSNTASTASNGTAVRLFVVEGILVNGTNAGTLIARAKREAVGTGPNVRAGSYGQLWRLT